MATNPTKQQLSKTLIAAAKAHHEFQTNYLSGVRHEQWAWWYSAYVLGRLNDFTTPTLLTKWLAEITDDKDWFNTAAGYISLKISNGEASD
ncbi:MAG: hypothetical protein ACYST2_05630 [Planctomycetota bacterium]|jgi:hypothetical protein